MILLVAFANGIPHAHIDRVEEPTDHWNRPHIHVGSRVHDADHHHGHGLQHQDHEFDHDHDHGSRSQVADSACSVAEEEAERSFPVDHDDNAVYLNDCQVCLLNSTIRYELSPLLSCDFLTGIDTHQDADGHAGRAELLIAVANGPPLFLLHAALKL